MVRVIRDGVIYKLRTGDQVSAFLSSGWQVYEPKKTVAEKPVPKKEPAKTTRRRKKASK